MVFTLYVDLPSGAAAGSPQHGSPHRGTASPVDDVTTTVEMSVDDDVGAATDDDEDDAVLRGLDDEVVSDIMGAESDIVGGDEERRRTHDRVSLRIDDSDVVVPLPPGNTGPWHSLASLCALDRH